MLSIVTDIYFLLLLVQIMTPKARADIHMNLPALQKLDSMLIVGGLFFRLEVWRLLIHGYPYSLD